MKDFIVSIRMFLFFTVLLGLAYPLLFTGAAQLIFPKQAKGGIIMRGGQAIGADLIGQKFESDKYFWSRPSAVDYNPLPSGGSNSGPTSEALKIAMLERASHLKSSNPDAGEPPQDLLFASASGLDPDITLEAADFQSKRIAKSRSLALSDVRELIKGATTARQFGILGEPRVNVLALNNALDAKQGVTSAPTPAPTPSSAPGASGSVPVGGSNSVPAK